MLQKQILDIVASDTSEKKLFHWYFINYEGLIDLFKEYYLETFDKQIIIYDPPNKRNEIPEETLRGPAENNDQMNEANGDGLNVHDPNILNGPNIDLDMSGQIAGPAENNDQINAAN